MLTVDHLLYLMGSVKRPICVHDVHVLLGVTLQTAQKALHVLHKRGHAFKVGMHYRFGRTTGVQSGAWGLTELGKAALNGAGEEALRYLDYALGVDAMAQTRMARHYGLLPAEWPPGQVGIWQCLRSAAPASGTTAPVDTSSEAE